MPIRDLLVPAVFCSDSAFDPATFAYALAVAGHCHAGIHLAAIAIPLGVGSPTGLAGGLVAAENRRLEEAAVGCREQAHRLAADAGVPMRSSIAQEAFPAARDRLVRMARCHDLAVAEADRSTIGIERGLVESLLLGSGRPVLVVPPGATWRLQQAFVAWDGSAGAARALHDAMPLLELTPRTIVVSIDEDAPGSDPITVDHLAAHLEAHGVIAEFRKSRTEGVLDAATLIGSLQPAAVDLLVMGGYGRSRLRELLLGGLTRGMLDAAPFPLLLSH